MNLAFSRGRMLFAVAALMFLIGAIIFSSSEPARAQPAADPAHAAHAAAPTDAAALAKQITELRDKVAKLEAALEKLPKSGMGGKGMAGMKTLAALPAFPGTSHIYHIGSTGFFLDDPERIKLTTEQRTALNQAKEESLLEQASFQQKIDDAEQEMGTLTSSDKPDATKIDAKVREIEKLRGDQRMAFIRAVGDAAKLLTDEQRQALLGTGTDKTDKAAKPDPHADHKP